MVAIWTQAMVLPMNSSQGGAQSVVQHPHRIDILVEGPNGPVATGCIAYREVLRLASLQRDPVDEMDESRSSTSTSVDVQVSNHDRSLTRREGDGLVTRSSGCFSTHCFSKHSSGALETHSYDASTSCLCMIPAR